MWFYPRRYPSGHPLPSRDRFHTASVLLSIDCVAGSDVRAPNLDDKPTRGSACAPEGSPAPRKLPIFVLESTEFQPLSQPQVPRFAWSSDCASMRSRGGTAVLELLATPARAVIIAADPGRRARCRGLPGGAAQEKIDIREIFGLVRFDTDDYLPVVSFTKRDDLFAFGHRPHANYRRPFVGSQLRHSGFSLRVSTSSLSGGPRFRNVHGQP